MGEKSPILSCTCSYLAQFSYQLHATSWLCQLRIIAPVHQKWHIFVTKWKNNHKQTRYMYCTWLHWGCEWVLQKGNPTFCTSWEWAHPCHQRRNLTCCLSLVWDYQYDFKRQNHFLHNVCHECGYIMLLWSSMGMDALYNVWQGVFTMYTHEVLTHCMLWAWLHPAILKLLGHGHTLKRMARSVHYVKTMGVRTPTKYLHTVCCGCGYTPAILKLLGKSMSMDTP